VLRGYVNQLIVRTAADGKNSKAASAFPMKQVSNRLLGCGFTVHPNRAFVHNEASRCKTNERRAWRRKWLSIFEKCSFVAASDRSARAFPPRVRAWKRGPRQTHWSSRATEMALRGRSENRVFKGGSARKPKWKPLK
jgi:hypothetical protein